MAFAQTTLEAEAAITQLYQNSALYHAPIEKRLDIMSRAFLGTPYILDALGEGPGALFDEDPLYRTDGFDCMTYVQTVLALTKAHDLSSFQKILLEIQYRKATPSFFNRLHFTDLDWNQQNEALGFIKDISQTITPHYKMATAFIDKPQWYQKMTVDRLHFIHPVSQVFIMQRLKLLHNHAKEEKDVESRMPYIPLSVLFNKKGNPNLALFNKIPSGAIIEIVRPNWDLEALIGTHLNVGHLGFAFQTSEGLIFREASSLEHKVVDVSLINYLRDYALNKDTTVKGISVFIVLANA